MENDHDDTDGAPRLRTTKSKRDSLPRSLSSDDGNNTRENKKTRIKIISNGYLQ